MARRKGSETPERSKLERDKDVAYAKRARTSGGSAKDDDDEAGDAPEPEDTQGKVTTAAPSDETKPVVAPHARDTKELPKIDPPPPKDEPWPDATPPPMKPVASRDLRPASSTAEGSAGVIEPSRTATETISMPVAAIIGRPPDMPKTAAPPPLALGQIENPTHMPGPRDIPSGNPDDPAPAPGRVPPGDSRSLRRDNHFALIYRLATYVITRSGKVGTRGQWRVVEYPTSSAASHAYAKECSRFVSEGFSDYRD